MHRLLNRTTAAEEATLPQTYTPDSDLLLFPFNESLNPLLFSADPPRSRASILASFNLLVSYLVRHIGYHNESVGEIQALSI